MELILLALLFVGLVGALLIMRCSELETRVDFLEDAIEFMQERDDYK